MDSPNSKGDSSLKISLRLDSKKQVRITKLENTNQKLNYKEIKYLGHEMEARCDVCLELYGYDNDKLVECSFCKHNVH